jgi:hypothetical protein
MTPVHKLCAGVVVITLATTYLAYLGASSSWQFYVSIGGFCLLYRIRIPISGQA